MKLVLASASPRRAALLMQAGIPFRVEAPSLEEEISPGEKPDRVVVRLALEKALSVSGSCGRAFVLGADTIVVCRDEVLGKPADRDDARRMLNLLGGKQHHVYTGLALVNASTGGYETAVARTRVWLKALSAGEIEAYLDTAEPMDKAGAYAIQGRAGLFVDRIDGCYSNVVGLPLGLLFELMKKMQFRTWLVRKDGDHGE